MVATTTMNVLCWPYLRLYLPLLLIIIITISLVMVVVVVVEVVARICALRCIRI